MKKAVFGLVSSEEQARRIIDHLLSAGFSNEDISLLYPDHKERNIHDKRDSRFGSEEELHRDASDDDALHGEDLSHRNVKKGHLTTEKHSKAPEGGVAGATAGGILGGSLGLLAGIGALAIPGVGPFIAAGPIVAALSGSAVGGGLGLLIGALVGSGIPEYEAKKYESGLKAGNILISVHTDSYDEIKQASDILKKDGAKDISSNCEKTKH